MRCTASSLLLPTLLLFLGFAPAWQPATHAQNVGDSVITAALGVPAEDAPGDKPLVYLTWWPTGEALWEPASYAVYSKPGKPDDGGSFSLASLVRPRTSALGAGQAINTAQRVGDDRAELSTNIDGLYDNVLPVSGMGLNEKLAAIVEVSQVDEDSAENLSLLSRRHPAVALAAGVAFLEPIDQGAVRTYEIRVCPDNFDGAADCGTVVGRVVFEGGKVRRLPAPGRPVEVPFVDDKGEEDPRGNLNVPLRWGTPADLREQSFFQFGYDVYRVDPKVAKKRDWGNKEPDRDTFFKLARENPEAFDRVNERPIMTEQVFTPAEAPDLNADPESYFVIDDNDRYTEDGEPFNDGDRFYYFVAARDVLGRPGEVSKGTPVTVHFRLPPQAPADLEVRNHFDYDAASDTQTQVLKLDWEPAETRENGPEIKEYWIYRWASMEQMHANQALPTKTLPNNSLTGGRIATVPASTTEYIDDQGPHPFITYSQEGDLETPAQENLTEANQTYWYTVRAVDAATGGGNVSGNSGPAYGVLRDRVGPEKPDGSVRGDCFLPVTSVEGSSLDPGEETFNGELTYLELSIQRQDPQIEWVEFYIGPMENQRSFLGRFDFGENDTVQTKQTLRNELFELDPEREGQGKIFARVGGANGNASDFAEATFQVALSPDEKTGNFVQSFDFLAIVDRESDCPVHQPRKPGTPPTDSITPVEIDLNLVPDTREWKLYRRVDDGPLTMIEQGITDYSEKPNVTTEDRDLPLNGGRVCYFLQVFDQHGNPSVFERLECITVAPRTELPKPMLSPVEPVGEKPQNGAARMEWFAPPDGVERFELAIRSVDGVPATTISDDLRLDVDPGNQQNNPDVSLGEIEGETYRHYLTGRLGADFDAGPDYTALWDENFSPGTEYAIRVRAVGAGETKGPWSNEESFIWSSEVDFSEPFDPSDCVVPWPVRGTPDADGTFPAALPPEAFEVGLKPVMNPQNPDGSVAYHGGAVRVGFVRLGKLDFTPSNNWDTPPERYDESSGIFPLPRAKENEGKTSDLISAFYARASSNEPLPDFMLYRYQVPNGKWDQVSGDVYQVSPLIDGIASAPSEFQGQPVHAVHDPYFFLLPINNTNNAYHLYLKDTQPVVAGAKYRYLVVRFTERGEIGQVIPLDPVTAD